MIDLTDRVALVTGAARGIGRATAITLAEAGAKVVVSDLRTPMADLDYATGEASGLEETARLIEASGGQAVAVTADVRDYDALRRAVATAVESFDRLDVVVANAGIASWPQTTWQATEAEWQTMIDVTLT
ncbi:MAG TPA: SDR family NAD(P)-dependent oxidoreductase, partial [Streptosporangiaceae bacterium]|nr:SDR family NAD(P)-dependent oxidoreductase [Streptosporangiaceae bacterium]